eukprot:Gb_23015 [translate_table: standard]
MLPYGLFVFKIVCRGKTGARLVKESLPIDCFGCLALRLQFPERLYVLPPAGHVKYYSNIPVCIHCRGEAGVMRFGRCNQFHIRSSWPCSQSLFVEDRRIRIKRLDLVCIFALITQSVGIGTALKSCDYVNRAFGWCLRHFGECHTY